MNTLTCQAEARKFQVLELLEQKIRAKFVLQVGDTRERIETIDNSYTDSLSNLEKSYKISFCYQ